MIGDAGRLPEGVGPLAPQVNIGKEGEGAPAQAEEQAQRTLPGDPVMQIMQKNREQAEQAITECLVTLLPNKESFLSKVSSSAALSKIGDFFKAGAKILGSFIGGALGTIALIALLLRRLVSIAILIPTAITLTTLGAIAGISGSIRSQSMKGIAAGAGLGFAASVYISNMIAAPIELLGFSSLQAVIKHCSLNKDVSTFLDAVAKDSSEDLIGMNPLKEIPSFNENKAFDVQQAWDQFLGRVRSPPASTQ